MAKAGTLADVLVQLRKTPDQKQIRESQVISYMGQKAQYLEIEYIEETLQQIFGLYSTEIKLHVTNYNPVTGIPFSEKVIRKLIVIVEGIQYSHDGISTVTYSNDPLNPVTEHNAAQIAASLALKDAAENLGERLGRSLNRGKIDTSVNQSAPAVNEKQKSIDDAIAREIQRLDILIRSSISKEDALSTLANSEYKFHKGLNNLIAELWP